MSKNKLLIITLLGSLIVFAMIYYVLSSSFDDDPFSSSEISKLSYLAEKGDGEACWCLFCYYDRIKDFEESSKWVEKGALCGDPRAQYLWAKTFLEENKSKEEVNKGIDILIKSASQDYVDAQRELGSLYDEGKLIKRNVKQSEYWYFKAAENGNYYAMFELSKFIKENYDNREMLIEAYKWTLLSIKLGSTGGFIYEKVQNLQKELLVKATQMGIEKKYFIKLAEQKALIDEQKIRNHTSTSTRFETSCDVLYSLCKQKIMVK